MMKATMLLDAHSIADGPQSSSSRISATALLRPPSTALAKSRADIGHDAIDNAIAHVAAGGQAALTAAPKKAVETSMERPTRILVARVFRVQELPREDIDFAVGHLARPAIDSSDSRCFRPGRSLPPRIQNITSLNRKGSPTEPARVGGTPHTPSIFGVRGRSVTGCRHAICPRRLGSTTTAGSPPRNTPATPSFLTSSSLSQRTTIARRLLSPRT
jgi:hypothetical protein